MAIKYKYSPEEFDKRVKAYHLDVETNQLAFPDLAGLKNRLAIEDDEYNAMFDDADYHDDRKEGVSEHDDGHMDSEKRCLEDRLQRRFRGDHFGHYNREGND